MKIGNIINTVDLSRCILWQYDNAPNIKAILEDFSQFTLQNSTEFFQDWHRDVFNLETANTFGLEVWGRILGAPRPFATAGNFGLDKDGNLRFYNAGTKLWYLVWLAHPQYAVSLEGIETVSRSGIKDDVYRRYLMTRIMLYYMRGTLPDLQKYFEALFPNSAVQVVSANDMTVQIIFYNALTDDEFVLLTIDGVIPEIAGVKITHIQISQNFGFQNEGEGGNPTDSYPFTWIDDGTTDFTGHGTFVN